MLEWDRVRRSLGCWWTELVYKGFDVHKNFRPQLEKKLKAFFEYVVEKYRKFPETVNVISEWPGNDVKLLDATDVTGEAP